ncbi:MAG: phosphatase PAP2 family protein [Micromonosporaceae bacterium]
MRRDLVVIAVALAAFAALTAALAAGGPLIELDLAVRAWSEAHRPPAADRIARVANRLGQGGALLGLSVLAAAVAARRGRTLRPLLYVATAALLLVPTVLAIKAVTERGAPSSPLPPERTVALLGPLPAGEYDAGFPSGHVVNTVVWYGVLLTLATVLLRGYGRAAPPRTLWWTVRVAPVVIVLFTSTYLSFHWLSDGLAGLALGIAIDRTLHLPRWRL